MEPSQGQSRKRFLLAGAVASVILLVAAFTATYVAGQMRNANVTKLFGGADGLQTVIVAEKAEAFRVARKKTEGGESKQDFGGAEILSGPIAVDEKTTRELAQILANPGTYGWDFAKGCIFDPGVAIRFTHKSSIVEVVFCFHCKELQVYRNGTKVGGEDFDAASNRLAAILKRVFPDDDEIQKL